MRLPLIRRPSSVFCRPIRRHHSAMLDRKREPTLLESKRPLAKQLTPPAVEGRHVRFIIGSDALEVIDRRDDLSGNAVPLGGHT